MTAPLPPIRPLPALRLLSAALVCVLALLGDMAMAMPTDLPTVKIDAAATDAIGTTPILAVDRSAIDLDDAFEHAGTAIDGVSVPKLHPPGAILARMGHGPGGVGSPCPERPPRG